MSEIKFRAWDKHSESMYDDLNNLAVHFSGRIVCQTGLNKLPQHQYILMQFTGLLDKNGKEIYEGDILQIPDDYDTFGMNAGNIQEIYFKAGGFRFKPIHNPKARGCWLEDDGEFEIMGNIYQNPELLKGSK